jgi:hypothetical protein
VQEIAASEFPFVEALPKREKSRAVKRWEALREYQELCERHGVLVPQSAVAEVLDLSHQRVSQIVVDGRLIAVRFHGHTFITHASLLEFAKMERKPGRPWKVPGEGLKAQVKIGVAVSRILKDASEK